MAVKPEIVSKTNSTHPHKTLSGFTSLVLGDKGSSVIRSNIRIQKNTSKEMNPVTTMVEKKAKVTFGSIKVIPYNGSLKNMRPRDRIIMNWCSKVTSPGGILVKKYT